MQAYIWVFALSEFQLDSSCGFQTVIESMSKISKKSQIGDGLSYFCLESIDILKQRRCAHATDWMLQADTLSQF